MGLLGLLGPALTVASNAEGAYQGAQAQGAEQQRNAIIQNLLMQRQQRAAEIENTLKQSQTGLANARVGDIQAQQDLRQYELQHPKPQPIDPLSPQGVAARTGMEHDKTDYDRTHGYHAPISSYEPTSITDPASGQVHVGKFNRFTGKTEDTGVAGKQPTTGQGGMGSLSPGAVQGMYEQAQHADAVMKAFEEKYRTNPGSLGTGSQALGAGAYQHQTGFLSGLAGAASNAALGMTNKDYQEYLAAQKRFGNIMGNLMSRRYSEYQGALDTQLAGLSSGDVEPTINLKQSYRADLLHNRPAGAHTAPTGGNGNHLPPLSLEDQQHAQRDPGFAAWLKSQGYPL